MTPSVKKVFTVFQKHYQEIPLIEVSKTPFQTLVATMLSARTRDETTAQVCKKLFEITADAEFISKLSVKELADTIKPVNFYKNKAKNLKKLSEEIIKRFGGNVPKNLEELTSLPGVGRKTANIVLARAFNIPAIGVDTHVHRIANVLGWVNTKTPEQTEKALTKILPKKHWTKINNLFVSIGQQYRTNERLKKFLQQKGLL
ncbi:MAG: endonuclease III [Candidatus Blackburnbacteria bacterium]|nr:endonuclease III [Candidatus Blackburnbacteria bacterium]